MHIQYFWQRNYHVYCHIPGHIWCIYHIYRVGQNRIYTPYMTVYLVISLPKIPYVHRVYIVLANPTHNTTHTHVHAQIHMLNYIYMRVHDIFICTYAHTLMHTHTHTRTRTQITTIITPTKTCTHRINIRLHVRVHKRDCCGELPYNINSSRKYKRAIHSSVTI